jgi:hypothetical protein
MDANEFCRSVVACSGNGGGGGRGGAGGGRGDNYTHRLAFLLGFTWAVIIMCAIWALLIRRRRPRQLAVQMPAQNFAIEYQDSE